jgi:hypothetical protein
MRIREVKLFTFEELDERAKERARDWYRQALVGDNYFAESVLEGAATACGMLGIELATRTVQLMGGGTRREPVIYWSGFNHQGQGACFEGRYRYAPGAGRKVRKEWPQDAELHRIADELQRIQRAWFYRLEASLTHRGSDVHEMSVAIDCDDSTGVRTVDTDTCEALADALRDVMRWVYRRLEAEYEHINSDESVDETIRANEYEFTEDGDIA